MRTETLLKALETNIDPIQLTLHTTEKKHFVEHLQKIHDAGNYDQSELDVNDFVDFCLDNPLLGDILEKADDDEEEFDSEMGEPIVEPTEEEEQAFFLENQMVIARLIKSFQSDDKGHLPEKDLNKEESGGTHDC